MLFPSHIKNRDSRSHESNWHLQCYRRNHIKLKVKVKYTNISFTENLATSTFNIVCCNNSLEWARSQVQENLNWVINLFHPKTLSLSTAVTVVAINTRQSQNSRRLNLNLMSTTKK